MVPASLALWFWRWLTVSSVLTGRSARTTSYSSLHIPSLPPSLISLVVSVYVKRQGNLIHCKHQPTRFFSVLFIVDAFPNTHASAKVLRKRLRVYRGPRMQKGHTRARVLKVACQSLVDDGNIMEMMQLALRKRTAENVNSTQTIATSKQAKPILLSPPPKPNSGSSSSSSNTHTHTHTHTHLSLIHISEPTRPP